MKAQVEMELSVQKRPVVSIILGFSTAKLDAHSLVPFSD